MKYTKYLVNRVKETSNIEDIAKISSLEEEFPKEYSLIFEKMKSIYNECITDGDNMFVENLALLDIEGFDILKDICNKLWDLIIEWESFRYLVYILVLINLKEHHPLDWKALQELSSDKLPAVVLDELQRKYNLSVKRINKEWKDRVTQINNLRPNSKVKCDGIDYAIIYHIPMIIDYLLQCKCDNIRIFKTLTLMDKLINAVMTGESYVSINDNLVKEFIECPIRFGKSTRLVSSKYTDKGVKVYTSMKSPFILYIECIFGFDKRKFVINYTDKKIEGVKLATDYLIILDVLSSCNHIIEGVICTGLQYNQIELTLNQELLDLGASTYFEADVMFADNRYEELMENGFRIVKSRQKPGKHAQKLLDEIGLELGQGYTIKII